MFAVMEDGGKRDLPSPVTLVPAAMPMETMETTIKRSILMRIKEVIFDVQQIINECGVDVLMVS